MAENSNQHRLRNWLLAFGFWTLLALSFSASGILSTIAEGHDSAWWRQTAWNFSDFYLWFAFTPIMIWLGQFGARSWKRFWAVHIPTSIIVAIVQGGLMLMLFWWICGPNPQATFHTFGGLLHQEAVYKFHFSLVTYWLFLVVLRGLNSQQLLKDERLRISRLEGQLAQSQLQALRMQLQPHFLFNTLNAISALALADPPQARLMIARLSDFLRLTLEERNAQQVSLSREMQFLECYLGIQQVRFQDRLSTHLDIASDTLGAAVPNLILQPLVENALRHGLLAKTGSGNLRITTRREGDLLRLRIEDDGLGLPPAGHHEGIGLSNTRERLQALFGASATLNLSRVEGGGTRVDLRFPFVENVP